MCPEQEKYTDRGKRNHRSININYIYILNFIMCNIMYHICLQIKTQEICMYVSCE